jgi:hypothetical protein
MKIEASAPPAITEKQVGKRGRGEKGVEITARAELPRNQDLAHQSEYFAGEKTSRDDGRRN